MKIKFSKQGLYDFYVADPECDLDFIYHRFLGHFGDDAENWYMEGSFQEIQTVIENVIWEGYQTDFVLNRYLNDGLAKMIE